MLDLSFDYLTFDGLASITCFPAGRPQVGNPWTPGAGVVIPHVNTGRIEVAEAVPSAGVYQRYRQRVEIPAVLAGRGAYIPAMGDVFRMEDNSLWTILAVGYPRFNNSYTCHCQQLLLAGGLSDTVSLLSSTITNVHGSKVVAHAAVQTGIAARIQPMDAQEIVLQQRFGFDVNYRVYTATDLEAKFDDLILDEGSEANYEIKSWADRKRIDVLSCYFCKLRP